MRPVMRNILFLTHTINKYCAVKLDGVYSAAKSRGWTVSDAEFGWTAWNISDIVSSLRPDGIIFEGGRLIGDVDLRALRGIPSVYLDTDFPAPRGRVAIRSDAAAIANLAADELIASAPAETVFFSLTPRKTWSKLRADSFRKRMRAIRKPFRVLNDPDDLAVLRKPFAVFAANDLSAATLFRSAKRLGLVCPRDFTLVSVDNETLFCENAEPKVSSVEQDFFQAGTAAVESLEQLFTRGTPRRGTILIPPKRLVRRASSVRPRPCKSIAQKVEAYIDLHALEPLGIADIAKSIGCSRRTAENHFRSAYGRSVGEAILARRFAEVEQRLADPGQLLDPIANLCGWRSSSNLKRSFRKRYGMTMSDWRNLKTGKTAPTPLQQRTTLGDGD